MVRAAAHPARLLEPSLGGILYAARAILLLKVSSALSKTVDSTFDLNTFIFSKQYSTLYNIKFKIFYKKNHFIKKVQ